MADYTPVQTDGVPRTMRTRWVDMGDGTHALLISANISAIVPGTGAASLGKAEEALHANGDVGVFMLGVRNDADAVLCTTDLSYSHLSTDDTGRLKTAPIAPAMMGLAAHVNAPAVNTAAVVTLAAAGVGIQNVLHSIHWGFSAAPAAGTTLIVEDGAGTTIFTTYISAAGPGFEQFIKGGRAGTANTAMIVTLAAGGAGVSGSLTLHADTQ